MAVDWGFAGQVGGIGFAFVFVVLIILAIAMWLVGVVISRIGPGKDKTGGERKGEH